VSIVPVHGGATETSGSCITPIPLDSGNENVSDENSSGVIFSHQDLHLLLPEIPKPRRAMYEVIGMCVSARYRRERTDLSATPYYKNLTLIPAVNLLDDGCDT